MRQLAGWGQQSHVQSHSDLVHSLYINITTAGEFFIQVDKTTQGGSGTRMRLEFVKRRFWQRIFI